MHELALAQQLLQVVEQTARANRLKNVVEIKIVVGEMMAVVPEALEFSFQVISQNTVAQGAKLVIEEQQALNACPQCQETYPWLEYGYRCPSCSHLGGKIIQGRDFYIDYIEGDEASSDKS
ncbi:MAG: hydrogenase maturation nickel metallochaperone HypA [Bacillota bacterium]|uniref:Hydrogenase maturation factor HypA n=1 Tax=Thermanaerosceptrum fracticalcis TaxID=1712410 RepID=A0A7G6E3P9_THEFR|nr:hydrogenase maturation nickel metallochaperone HypA [Thermanaerosceptrum fracticalcis]QNB46703.1 hydrogenase maturation nickel metallochaperone HypA [Thermanaerosceptrum fracticalcis]